MRDEDDNTATNNTRPRSNTANLNDYELESTLETIAALSLQNKNLIKTIEEMSNGRKSLGVSFDREDERGLGQLNDYHKPPPSAHQRRDSYTIPSQSTLTSQPPNTPPPPLINSSGTSLVPPPPPPPPLSYLQQQPRHNTHTTQNNTYPSAPPGQISGDYEALAKSLQNQDSPIQISLSDPRHAAQLSDASSAASPGGRSTTSQVQSSIASDDAWLVITVELGGGITSRDIEVRYGDDPKVLADKFCADEGLGTDAAPAIADYIAQHIEEEQAQMDMIENGDEEEEEEEDEEEEVGEFDEKHAFSTSVPR